LTRSAADPSHLRHLLAGGHSAEVPPLADRALRGDEAAPEVRAELLLLRLAALINLGRRGAYLGALDEATAAVRACPDPELYGRLYTLAALIANLDGAIERCVTYLVQSARALRRVHRVDRIVACAWHDLAMAYSYAGLHGYALSAIERARRMAVTAELPEAEFVVPAIRMRLAVWHDHHGDTDACVRVLRDVVADLAWHERVHPDGLPGIRPGSLGAYGYAAARLAALGQSAPLPTLSQPAPPTAAGGAETPATPPDVADLLARAGQGERGRDLRTLGTVCLAIAAGSADEAIALLDAAQVAPVTLGAAEPQRLRALAHLAAGDIATARTADRRAYRIASANVERLHELYVEAVAARIDQQDLQRSVAERAANTLTDPLTGLFSRRYLDTRIAALRSAGEPAVLVVCDLDGLGTVNETHGRLAGELVLQRMASVLARGTRRGDLVSRYGSARFAVLLPGAVAEEAREVCTRIEGAVAAEDWAELTPGTPPTISVSWSEVGAAPRARTGNTSHAGSAGVAGNGRKPST
jgi:diguanylate cyclase (GGDEF)-like protein